MLAPPLNKTRQVLRDITQVQHLVAHAYGYTIHGLLKPSRKQPLAMYRQIAIAIAREVVPDNRLIDLAVSFGKDDHSTVIAACESIKNRMQTDPELKKKYAILKKQAEAIVHNSHE